MAKKQQGDNPLFTVNLADLTAQQKAALLEELQNQQREQELQKANKRKEYKALVDGKVSALFPILKKTSASLAAAKGMVREYLKQVLELKGEVFGVDDKQSSHTFTNSDGTISIIIGYNMIDAYDDTADSGIAKVKGFILKETQTSNARHGATIEAMGKLLAKDSKGTLKPSRVLQLKQFAEKIGDSELIDGVSIIQAAYRPVRSKEFIRCYYKGADGESISLPLSITDAEPEAEAAPE